MIQTGRKRQLEVRMDMSAKHKAGIQGAFEYMNDLREMAENYFNVYCAG